MVKTPAHTALLPATHYTLTATDIARFNDEQSRGMMPPTAAILCEEATPVPLDALASEPIQEVIGRLFDIAVGQRRVITRSTRKGGRRTLVGLAAPQIGEPYRIILIDTRATENRRHYGKLECLINPEIVWRTVETVEGREGCFSAGPVWGLVRRPAAVKICAVTPEGKPVERIFEGFTARIACHELDHLDGVRFPERIRSDRKRHWVHTEELTEYPNRIHNWHRLCTMQRWKAFKRGAIL